MDKVGEGIVNWKTVIRNFYPDLDEAVQKAEKELEEVKIEDEVSDVQLRSVRSYDGHQVRSSR